MATTEYFNEIVSDQSGKTSLNLEVGRSSFYNEASLYIKVDEKMVILSNETAKRFIEAVQSIGQYHSLV
jgi:hypothetical protein